MILQRFIIFTVILSCICVIGCKEKPTEPSNGGGTTPASIGDSVPNANSLYFYQRSQLDNSDNVNKSTIIDSLSAAVLATDVHFQGKTAYVIQDQLDSALFS